MNDSQDARLEEGKRLVVDKAHDLARQAASPLDEARWTEESADEESLVLVLRRGASEVADWFDRAEVESFGTTAHRPATIEKLRRVIGKL